MSKTCRNCRFSWDARNFLGDGVLACRRYPPIGPRGWARTAPTNWCGEHQPKATDTDTGGAAALS